MARMQILAEPPSLLLQAKDFLAEARRLKRLRATGCARRQRCCASLRNSRRHPLATENLTRRRIAVDGLCGNAAPARLALKS